MNRFAQIPGIPDGLPHGLTPILQAMKENIDALTGLSGIDKLAQAVKYGEVLTKDIVQQSVVAAGAAPTKAEFDLAVEDLQQLIQAHNYLASQLRGEKVGT